MFVWDYYKKPQNIKAQKKIIKYLVVEAELIHLGNFSALDTDFDPVDLFQIQLQEGDWIIIMLRLCLLYVLAYKDKRDIVDRLFYADLQKTSSAFYSTVTLC